mgnify:FL=1
MSQTTGKSMGVSIHAPARGATDEHYKKQQEYKVSIHAPARGATSRERIMILASVGFNPRSREGSDRFKKC